MGYEPVFNDKITKDIEDRLGDKIQIKIIKDSDKLECSVCGKTLSRGINDLGTTSLGRYVDYLQLLQLEHYIIDCKSNKANG